MGGQWVAKHRRTLSGDHILLLSTTQIEEITPGGADLIPSTSTIALVLPGATWLLAWISSRGAWASPAHAVTLINFSV
jgi:hypothetical protein